MRWLTLAFTFVIATIVLNTPIDGGPGVYLSAVAASRIAPSGASSFYLMGLALALMTLLAAFAVFLAKLGAGLFAIHDDEDVAEVLGVPTFRYKIGGLRDLVRVRRGGRRPAGAVRLLCDGQRDLFDHGPLSVVLMSVLGGTRHWAGPPSAPR